jgi:hypothetical protein
MDTTAARVSQDSASLHRQAMSCDKTATCRGLAAYLAACAGMSAVDLAARKTPPPYAPAVHGDPAAATGSRPAPTSKHLADSVLCAAAEAMQASPHAMRPAFAAGLHRMIELGLGAEEVLRALTPEKARPRQV